MPKIEGLRIKNFKSLKDIALGKLREDRKAVPLTPLTAVIGKNGVGKSSLFDALGFLADALKFGVEEACDLRNRGGFEKIRSRGADGAIEFEIYYRENDESRPITYELSIAMDELSRPYVAGERLRQRIQKRGRPFSFLLLEDGKGRVWRGDAAGIRIKDNESIVKQLNSITEKDEHDSDQVELEDKRRLGIATLGSLKQHPRISAFRKFIEGWYLSYFTPDAVRRVIPLAGPQKHLDMHGENLGNVVQFMEREHPRVFQSILNRISKKIPGIDTISTEKTKDGRLLLCFNNKGFQDPFYSQQISDGTLKVFAYLLMLEDPEPPPFLCIEEPENGLYHKLLEILAREFREHAENNVKGSQVFMTTHQPYLVDALQPEEVWILDKGLDGFSTIQRASQNPLVKNLTEEGLPLGGLWYSDYLDPR